MPGPARPYFAKWLTVIVAAAIWLPTYGAELIITGSLSGTGAPQTQTVAVAQFDDLGGTRLLQSVRLSALTAIGGGYTTDGSGVAVDVNASLVAEYSQAGQLLVATEAMLTLHVVNTGPPISVSVFDNDVQETLITDLALLPPWIGTGSISLAVFTSFSIQEVPAGVIFFGAGGTVQYTITYTYVVAPPSVNFLRGDCTGDLALNIADAVRVLGALFPGSTPAPVSCADACDSNDDGALNIADPIYLLNFLFVPGSPLPPPPDGCGDDPTLDALDCQTMANCP